MPIRETDANNLERIDRSFDFGDLLSLHMIDTRLIGRDKQLSYLDYFSQSGSFDAARFVSELSDPERSLLGQEQMGRLSASLAKSNATWQLLGQQVIMAPFLLPAPLVFQQIGLPEYFAIVTKAQTSPQDLSAADLAILSAPSIPLSLDAWDGYPAAREQVLQTALALDKNLISLAGDSHNAWASDLDTLGGEAVGVEFATSSVSSPGFEEYLPDVPPDLLASALTQFISSLKFANTQHRGYLLVSFSHEKTVATWTFIDTVKSLDYQILEERTKSLTVLPGSSGRRLQSA